MIRPRPGQAGDRPGGQENHERLARDREQPDTDAQPDCGPGRGTLEERQQDQQRQQGNRGEDGFMDEDATVIDKQRTGRDESGGGQSIAGSAEPAQAERADHRQQTGQGNRQPEIALGKLRPGSFPAPPQYQTGQVTQQRPVEM